MLLELNSRKNLPTRLDRLMGERYLHLHIYEGFKLWEQVKKKIYIFNLNFNLS